MKDIAAHVKEIVKDALATQIRGLGIDKSEVGFLIFGFGEIGMTRDVSGREAVAPLWKVTISLRHKLIGYPEKIGTVVVPGLVPSDAEFRDAVKNLATRLNEVREKEFLVGTGVVETG